MHEIIEDGADLRAVDASDKKFLDYIQDETIKSGFVYYRGSNRPLMLGFLTLSNDPSIPVSFQSNLETAAHTPR